MKDTRQKLQSEIFSDHKAEIFVGRYKGKNRLIWGKGNTSTVDMSTSEFADFLKAVTDAVERLDSRKSRKTESLSRALSDSNKRIWGYHNGDVQLQWSTLLRKVPEKDFRCFADTIKEVLKILEKREKEGAQKLQTKRKVASIHFYLGFLCLVIMGISAIATVLFAFFLIEFIIVPLYMLLGSVTGFVIFLYLQQENIPGFLKQCKSEWSDNIVPIVSNIPVQSRKGIELGIIMLIVMIFLGFYFAKALPTIMESRIFSIM